MRSSFKTKPTPTSPHSTQEYEVDTQPKQEIIIFAQDIKNDFKFIQGT